MALLCSLFSRFKFHVKFLFKHYQLTLPLSFSPPLSPPSGVAGGAGEGSLLNILDFITVEGVSMKIFLNMATSSTTAFLINGPEAKQ